MKPGNTFLMENNPLTLEDSLDTDAALSFPETELVSVVVHEFLMYNFINRFFYSAL